MGGIAIAAALGMQEPVAQLAPKRLGQARRETPLPREQVESPNAAEIASRRAAYSAVLSSRRSLRPTSARPSAPITNGNNKPWPTRVTRITKTSGKGSGRDRERMSVLVANGMASAAASETIPRTPVKARAKGHCQGGAGSLRLIEGMPAGN